MKSTIERDIKIKSWLAVLSFVFAIIFGMCAFWCPPLSVIPQSILWFTAQLLVFACTMLGISINIDALKSLGNKNPE